MSGRESHSGRREMGGGEFRVRVRVRVRVHPYFIHTTFPTIFTPTNHIDDHELERVV